MSEKKNNSLLKLQLGGILVFFIAFLIYANTQCNTVRQGYKEKYEAKMAIQDSLERLAAAAKIAEDSVAQENAVGSTATDSPIFPKSVLYVSIEGLKVRDAPSLKSEVLTELSLYEEVIFLHEVSENVDSINLGKAIAGGHWVKVKSKKGHEGWVYEPGVYFYRRKNPDSY